MVIQQICIIGAGISGLVTAKTFIEEGYDVTIFEKQTGLGGVWEKSRTYPGLTTQNTGDTYCFSDYPMPASYPEWPTAEHLQNYLESYAKHFGVKDKIRFQTEVIKLVRKTEAESGWIVSISIKDANGVELKQENHEFDFVVVCNGLFSQPKIPFLLGREQFTASGGKILHSTELNDISIIEGKRVVVVGSGKSACDIANIAANTAKECTLIFRQANWKVPRFFLGLVNMKYLLLTRFSECWFPYRKMVKVETLLHSIGKPLVWFFWRFNERLIRWQLNLDAYDMVPEKPLNKFDCSPVLCPVGFFDNLKTGKILPIKTSIAKFIPGGLDLVNGQQLQAEVVIFGTGFSQDIPFLEEQYRSRIVDENGNFYLYRHIIHPDIPQIGFVGNNASFYSPLTAEVAAWWLVDYVKGHLSLPITWEMHQEIVAELDWLKNQLNIDPGRGTCIASFSLRYVEQLLIDMGGITQLDFWKKIPQLMMPVNPSYYYKLRQQIKMQRLEKISQSSTASAQVKLLETKS